MRSYLRKIFLAIVLILPTAQAQAFDWGCCGCDSFSIKDVSFEGRVAYFRPTNKHVKDLYSDGWATYEVRANIDFCNNFEAWVGVDWSEKKGRSRTIGCGCDARRGHTKVEILPVSFGLKYIIPLNCDFNFYVGAGAVYSNLRIKDNSEFVNRKFTKHTWGAIVETGVYYQISCNFFADFFIDYIYQEFHVGHHRGSSSSSSSSSFAFSADSGSRFSERRKLDLSGFKVGGGLGVKF